MEKYKLKKDTFFYKAGTICKLTPKGNMVLDDNQGTCLLHDYQLKDHPEILDEWFEKIEKKKYGGRVPKKGDKFWLVGLSGSLNEFEWGWGVYNVDVDEDKAFGPVWFEAGNAFWTREEAEKERKRRKAYVILKEDTKGFVPDWENPYSEGCSVYYSRAGKHLDVFFSFCRQNGLIYFATRADAEASIKAHRQQWLDYLCVEEEE